MYNGTVFSCGRREFCPVLPDSNHYEDYHIPTKIRSLSDIKAITAGASHPLALNKAGFVYAWGHNEFG